MCQLLEIFIESNSIQNIQKRIEIEISFLGRRKSQQLLN